MPKIKGPIHFKNGFDIGEVLKKNKDKIKVNLPFKAKNFKSSKMPENINTDGIEMAKEKKSQKTDNFRKELIGLNGVGEVSADIIVKMARNKTELRKIPRQTLIDELRDDVVEVLDKYLGKK